MRHEPCPACGGTGLPDEDGNGRCTRCQGLGYVITWLDYADHLATRLDADADSRVDMKGDGPT